MTIADRVEALAECKTSKELRSKVDQLTPEIRKLECRLDKIRDLLATHELCKASDDPLTVIERGLGL